jgi:acetyl-CoA carboxylase carboxyltransferase component
MPAATTNRGSIRLRRQVDGLLEADVVALGSQAVVFVRTDTSRHRGGLTAADGETLVRAASVALAERLPLVGVITTSGADVTDGLASLHGWGRAARAIVSCSGIVPVAVAVAGPALAGPAFFLGLADLVAMTPDAYAYVCGPGQVAQFTGIRLSATDLGGPAVHGHRSGVASFVAPDEGTALAWLAAALGYLPAHTDEEAPRIDSEDPVARETPELRDAIPVRASGTYDVRSIVRGVVDDGEFLEVRPQFAPSLVTGLASIGGRPVGVVANQSQAQAGTLDIWSSQKGAGFVGLCDSFGLPLVTFVDTPGFFPGKDLEWRGMIRHGAQLAFAYAEATVPRLCVILRKAYGGAYIVMDSRRMGNDFCVAWPSAEVAVMGASGAVQILYRDLDEQTRQDRQADYEERVVSPWVASERGLIDDVIDPARTRPVLAAALEQLAVKRERLPGRKHSNTPL